MSHLAATDDLFFNRAGLDQRRLEKVVDDALDGADDGELFLEYRQSESLAFDDGRLKSASFDTSQGFGLRSVPANPPAMPTPVSSARRPSSAPRTRSRQCIGATAAP